MCLTFPLSDVLVLLNVRNVLLLLNVRNVLLLLLSAFLCCCCCFPSLSLSLSLERAGRFSFPFVSFFLCLAGQFPKCATQACNYGGQAYRRCAFLCAFILQRNAAVITLSDVALAVRRVHRLANTFSRKASSMLRLIFFSITITSMYVQPLHMRINPVA